MNDQATPPRRRLLPRFLAEPLRQVDAEAQLYTQRHGDRFDRKIAIVLTTAAVALVIQEYVFVGWNVYYLPVILKSLGMTDTAKLLARTLLARENREIAELTFWAIGRVITYVLIPLPVMLFLIRDGLRGYGMKVRGSLRTAWIYAVMFLLMFPAVWFFSTTASFQAKYPFYDLLPGESLWPRFWIWEALYAIQFISLEFFFRGFILHGVKHRFGSAAIFVMMVPYCMIHFEKPMPETFGAIFAGIILGYMSLTTRSIWGGAALHIGVALSMDLLALAAR